MSLCECGCGSVTKVAKKTRTVQGIKKGQHNRFIYGHFKRAGVGPYVSMHIGNGAVEREHRQIAERALGRPLPAKSEIHHVDGDGRNNRPGNLVICEDTSYHQLLHKRARIRSAGGNPDSDAWCSGCRAPRPMDLFTLRLTGRGAGGFVSYCRNCAREKDRRRRAA
jgi:hypothetical protein